MNVYSTPYLAEQRLREEYRPPHLLQPAPDPRILRAPQAPKNRAVKALCDVMLSIAMEMKRHEGDEQLRRDLTMEILICCYLLQQLGYHAHADLGRKLFVQVTRLDALKEIHHG